MNNRIIELYKISYFTHNYLLNYFLFTLKPSPDQTNLILLWCAITMISALFAAKAVLAALQGLDINTFATIVAPLLGYSLFISMLCVLFERKILSIVRFRDYLDFGSTSSE